MSTDRLTRRVASQAGVTLVELVMYIVVVSVGVAGILSVMTYTTRYSADPMVQQQALLIAESYMEEILQKYFIDRVPTTATTICPAPEANRGLYDNVCDYHGLNDAGARDQFGGAIAGLGAYDVSVAVTGSVGDTVALNNINNTGVLRVLRVDVRVTNGATDVRLTGYRTNYRCNVSGDAACLPRQ